MPVLWFTYDLARQESNLWPLFLIFILFVFGGLRSQATKRYVLKHLDNPNPRRQNPMKIDERTYKEISEFIHSDKSPVGIDAKKTHIYIIHMLNQIEERLEALEKKQA